MNDLKNVGSVDKVIRLSIIVALSIGCIWAISTSSIWLAVGLGTGAAILLGTVLTSTCPIWLMLRVNTRKQSVRS